jgi:subtilase family serine protease
VPPTPPATGSFEYCPNNFQTVYGVNSIPSGNGGAGRKIAIVDAFHYAGAENDLNLFSALLGLPACTVASGCLTIVGQTGGAPPPTTVPPTLDTKTWELEEMLDLEYAHAMAPNAKLVMVECNSDSGNDLFTGVQTGTALADIVSNSWGGGEDGSETSFDFVFSTNNKPVFFSSGDSGTPAQYPCTSPHVTCVGGTTLNVNTSYVRTTETGWSGSGGGCSAFEPAVFWQNPIPASAVVTVASNCTNGVSPTRAVPDIAAAANPATGAAVIDLGRDSTHYIGVGGTSLACPLMAGLFADIMTARATFGLPQLDNNINLAIYAAAIRNYTYFFYDVTVGNNGLPAGPDYDLVTGLGVPKGSAMGNRFFGLVYVLPPPPPSGD